MVTKDELIEIIAQKAKLTKEEVGKIIDVFIEQIKEQLSRGEKVVISGFGTFVLSRHQAKTFVHPKTGQTKNLPDRVFPHFKAGEELQKNLR